jgi:hypothetical protein
LYQEQKTSPYPIYDNKYTIYDTRDKTASVPEIIYTKDSQTALEEGDPEILVE